MKLLRITALVVFIGFLALPAFAQTSRSQINPSLTSPFEPSTQLSAQPETGFVRNPFLPQTGESSSEPPQLKSSSPFKFTIEPNPMRREFSAQERRFSDPGIYIKAGFGNTCGTMVSYNFSAGDNPHLKSVTTCTSLNTVATRNAEGEDKKPPAPRVIYTK